MRNLRVDRHPFDGGVRIEHSFADRWVGVDGEHQFVDGAFEFHDGYRFGDEFCGLRADDVHTEDFAILGIGNDLDEAVVTADDAGLGISRKRKLADLDLDCPSPWPALRSCPLNRSAGRNRCRRGRGRGGRRRYLRPAILVTATIPLIEPECANCGRPATMSPMA